MSTEVLGEVNDVSLVLLLVLVAVLEKRMFVIRML